MPQKHSDTTPPPGQIAVIPKEEPIPQPQNVPLELQVNIIGQRQIGKSYREVPVTNGSVLLSNDNLKIHFRVTRDCYIYVLLFDSELKANLLFPSSLVGFNNKVKGNKEYQVPSGNNWFYLDEKTGEETIYVIADVSPMDDIDQLLASMEGKGKRQQIEDSSNILAKSNIRNRGIGGVRTGPLAILKQVAELTSKALRRLWKEEAL